MNRMNNVLRVIFPYQDQGQWMFDDEATGLVREPFVYGADKLLDVLTHQIPNATNGVKVFFSHLPFPGATELQWLSADVGGNWYRVPSLRDLDAWLCPALLRYFEAAPVKIYIRAEAKSADGGPVVDATG